MPAPGLRHTVHGHFTALDEQLGVAAGGRGAGQLEERTERQRPVDDDVVQLLSRIGMMR